MRRLLQIFNNLAIGRKLLLASVIPIVTLIALSVVTYRNVEAFSADEEQLNNIYLVQRRAAEYMRLIVDSETGFRGYVLTRQEDYLKPYREAHDRVLSVGSALIDMVQGRPAQSQILQEVQKLVEQLITEKDTLVRVVAAGRTDDAVHYMEKGLGRTKMLIIREHMSRFDRLEQDVLNDTLLKLGQDRSSMVMSILGGGLVALVLLILTLQLIARSITGPLGTLAKAVGNATGPTLRVPVMDRKDEIGHLTRIMGAMSAQINDHIVRMEKSETELRASNRDLMESESKYRSLVDHAPFGIFTTRGMAVTFSNRYNHVLAGLNPDEENDPEAFRRSIHPQDRTRVLSEFADAVAHDRPYETIFRFLREDGTVRKVLSRRIPIRDMNGRTIMYQGFNIDITALDRMQGRLRQAERLATLGQVAAGIAHEIRNPLVGIGSTASLLLEDAGASDPHRGDLEVILNETRRLDRIVNQIVDYARPRELAPAPFALSDLLAESLSLLEPTLAARRITVTERIHPNLSALVADRDLIKQVFLNVLHNSIEAMDGGTLAVAAFNSTRDGQPGLLVEVTDTGVGIPPADLGRVFEPFFTSGKPRGTGLGLAISRNIIEAHRGDIVLESRPAHGTTVRIWLPLKPPSEVS